MVCFRAGWYKHTPYSSAQLHRVFVVILVVVVGVIALFRCSTNCHVPGNSSMNCCCCCSSFVSFPFFSWAAKFVPANLCQIRRCFCWLSFSLFLLLFLFLLVVGKLINCPWLLWHSTILHNFFFYVCTFFFILATVSLVLYSFFFSFFVPLSIARRLAEGAYTLTVSFRQATFLLDRNRCCRVAAKCYQWLANESSIEWTEGMFWSISASGCQWRGKGQHWRTVCLLHS